MLHNGDTKKGKILRQIISCSSGTQGSEGETDEQRDGKSCSWCYEDVSGAMVGTPRESDQPSRIGQRELTSAELLSCIWVEEELGCSGP